MQGKIRRAKETQMHKQAPGCYKLKAIASVDGKGLLLNLGICLGCFSLPLEAGPPCCTPGVAGTEVRWHLLKTISGRSCQTSTSLYTMNGTMTPPISHREEQTITPRFLVQQQRDHVSISGLRTEGHGPQF